MKELDDLFEELYKDDPEGYAEFKMKTEQNRMEVNEIYRKHREKVAEIFTMDRDEEVDNYIRGMKEEDLLKHSSQLSAIIKILERANRKFSSNEDFFTEEDQNERNKNDVNKKIIGLLKLNDRTEIVKHIEELSKTDIVVTLSKVKKYYEEINQQYEKRLKEEVFSVSATTLKNLVDRNDWETVEKELFTIFPTQAQNKDGYEYVYSELKRLKPVENKEGMVITVFADSEGSFDVSGIKPGENTSYAIEFCPWEEWLGLYVSQRDLQKHGELVCIAHCLWEMTFSGFTQESIQGSMEDILERVEEAEKNISDEKE